MKKLAFVTVLLLLCAFVAWRIYTIEHLHETASKPVIEGRLYGGEVIYIPVKDK